MAWCVEKLTNIEIYYMRDFRKFIPLFKLGHLSLLSWDIIMMMIIDMINEWWKYTPRWMYSVGV